MTVELISVGTEILMGNILNTNAKFLAEKCAGLGYEVLYQTSVGDNPERLRRVIRTALDRTDLIILSGGLGPTEDDITKDICCEEMGIPLVEDTAVRQAIDDWLAARKRTNIAKSIYRQAMVPEGQTIFINGNGTAPGLAIEKDGKCAVLLPGPPGELIPMTENQVIPYLGAKSDSVLRSRMIKICGIGESTVEERLLDLIDAQTNPTIATYAKPREVHVRVTAKAPTAEEAEEILMPVVREITGRFPREVFTTEEKETLEGIAVTALPTKREYKLGERLDTTGLALETITSKGNHSPLTGGFICSPEVLNTAGIQTITVSYEGKSTSFTVTVQGGEKTVQKISIETLPAKLNYQVGDSFDTSGMVLRVTTDQGDELVRSGFTCSPSRFTHEGVQTITVSYGSQSCTMELTVAPVEDKPETTARPTEKDTEPSKDNDRPDSTPRPDQRADRASSTMLLVIIFTALVALVALLAYLYVTKKDDLLALWQRLTRRGGDQ